MCGHDDIMGKACYKLVKGLQIKETKIKFALVSEGVIKGDDMKHIEEGNKQERNLIRAIIHFISKRPPRDYMKFRRVLIKEGERELVKSCLPIPTEYRQYAEEGDDVEEGMEEPDGKGDVQDRGNVQTKPSSSGDPGNKFVGMDEHVEILDKALYTLVTKLRLKETSIRDALISEGVIAKDDLKFIQEGNEQERNLINEIVIILQKKPAADYMKFRWILRQEGQGEIVKECLPIPPNNPAYVEDPAYVEKKERSDPNLEEVRKKRLDAMDPKAQEEPAAKEEVKVLSYAQTT